MGAGIRRPAGRVRDGAGAAGAGDPDARRRAGLAAWVPLRVNLPRVGGVGGSLYGM